jgi:hypothetical protein
VLLPRKRLHRPWRKVCTRTPARQIPACQISDHKCLRGLASPCGLYTTGTQQAACGQLQRRHIYTRMNDGSSSKRMHFLARPNRRRERGKHECMKVGVERGKGCRGRSNKVVCYRYLRPEEPMSKLFAVFVIVNQQRVGEGPSCQFPQGQHPG